MSNTIQLTQEQFDALIAKNKQLEEQLANKNKPKFNLQAKVTAKGLYIRSTEVNELSKDGKNYNPSMMVHNYQLGLFKKILEDSSYREAIAKAFANGSEVRI